MKIVEDGDGQLKDFHAQGEAAGVAPPAAAAATSFSRILKVETQAAHLRAEREFQSFLKYPAGELASFLSAQLCAHEGLLAACVAPHPATRALVDRLRRDCLASGGVRQVLPHVPRLDDLAVNYLVFGGRKGVAVIRRMMQRSGDTAIPAHFHDDAMFDAAWADVLAELDAVVPGSPQSGTILRDVTAGFRLFETAVAQCRAIGPARITT